MKKFLVFILVFSAFAKAHAQSPQQEMYQRAKISLDATHTLAHLNNLDIAADHGEISRNRHIISTFSVSELAKARANGYEVEVLIEDAKAHFLAQNKLPSQTETRNPDCSGDTGETYKVPDNFNLGSMGGYLTYQELLNELDDMVALFPNLISTKAPISDFLTEGQPDNSVTPSIGSNPIYWLKISDNPNSDTEGEAQVLYTSLHHAREPMSLMQMVFYMWYLLENYETDAKVRALVNNTELYFVPVVNPDGYLYNEATNPNGGGFWRKNRKNGYGVDNNRNYDYHINGNPNNGSWGGPGSSSNTGSEVHHGSGPFSEVENQAIKWFVEQHDFVLAFNNHSFGRLFYFPFGYANVATPDEGTYQALGAALASRNGYTPLRDSPFAGDSDDFMYGTVGTHDKIFAFTPEIGNAFWPPSNQIISTSRDMLYSNLLLAYIASNYASVLDTSPAFISSTSASASFEIERLGLNGTGDFEVSLVPTSGNIDTIDSPVSISSLDLLETTSGTIGYTLSDDIATGETVSYDLMIDNGSYSYPISVSKVFGELAQVFLENGDSSTAQFENNDWGTTTSTFVSPSSAITDSPNGNYDSDENSTITLSEPVNLVNATTAMVSFYARWEVEATWDYVQFEISTDDGATWEPQCGEFTKLGTNNQPIGEPLYDGQSDWIQENIDLSDYLGETILARFQLVSDNTEERDGFYFDDLAFSIASSNLGVTDDAFAKAFSLYPNPVKNILNIKTNLGAYNAQVYNLLGQKMGGLQELQGNSTIDYSNYANGIYLIELSSKDARTVLKVVKN